MTKPRKRRPSPRLPAVIQRRISRHLRQIALKEEGGVKEMSRELKVHPISIWGWMRGRSDPNAEVLRRLRRSYGTDLNRLLMLKSWEKEEQ